MKKKTNKLAIALAAVAVAGGLFVGGSAIAAAANERSLVDEWKSWGQVEQVVETPDDDINTDIETGDENTGDETNTETGDENTGTEGAGEETGA